jgi:ribosomal protein S18 acetylase RimI-like enzyme
MTKANETSSRECRFLSDDSFSQLYDTFIEAFSDYVFPFALTPEQFQGHLLINAVDINRSIGCFKGRRLLGFSLNGFGVWNGKATVYDAGTGVVPGARRQGISRRMFESMIPVFESDGVEQFLLEVITTNTAALRLYERLGFEKTRKLALLQCDTPMAVPDGHPDEVELRELKAPNWDVFLEFWRAEPSWQNSREAVDRSPGTKRVIAAHIGDVCVGYTVFSMGLGRISQIAVSSGYAGRGIGKRLLRAVQDILPAGRSLQVINADMSNVGVCRFFESLGFYELLSQYEMIKEMSSPNGIA